MTFYRLFQFLIFVSVSLSFGATSEGARDLVERVISVRSGFIKAVRSYLDDAARIGSSSEPSDKQLLNRDKNNLEKALKEYRKLIEELINILKQEVVDDPAFFNRLRLDTKQQLMGLIESTSSPEREIVPEWGLKGLKAGSLVGALGSITVGTLLVGLFAAIAIKGRGGQEEYSAAGPSGPGELAGMAIGGGLLLAPVIGFVSGAIGLIGGTVAGLLAPGGKTLDPNVLNEFDAMINKLSQAELLLQNQIQLQQLLEQQRLLQASYEKQKGIV